MTTFSESCQIKMIFLHILLTTIFVFVQFTIPLLWNTFSQKSETILCFMIPSFHTKYDFQYHSLYAKRQFTRGYIMYMYFSLCSHISQNFKSSKLFPTISNMFISTIQEGQLIQPCKILLKWKK